MYPSLDHKDQRGHKGSLEQSDHKGHRVPLVRLWLAHKDLKGFKDHKVILGHRDHKALWVHLDLKVHKGPSGHRGQMDPTAPKDSLAHKAFKVHKVLMVHKDHKDLAALPPSDHKDNRGCREFKAHRDFLA